MDFYTIGMCCGLAIRLRILHLRSDSVRDVMRYPDGSVCAE